MSTFKCKVLPNAYFHIILTGKILLFTWDARFYIGTPILIVKTGKIPLFAWGAYFHSGMPIFIVKMDTRVPISRKYRHRDAYIHVNTAPGMRIFGDAYTHLTSGCPYLRGVHIFMTPDQFNFASAGPEAALTFHLGRHKKGHAKFLSCLSGTTNQILYIQLL